MKLHLSIRSETFGPNGSLRSSDIHKIFQDLRMEHSIKGGFPLKEWFSLKQFFVPVLFKTYHFRELTLNDQVEVVGNVEIKRLLKFAPLHLLASLEVKGEPVVVSSQKLQLLSLDGFKPISPNERILNFFSPEGKSGTPEWEELNQKVHTEIEGVEREFSFPCWYNWIDALDHVNNVIPLSWVDEAISRALSAKGMDPFKVVPIYDQIRWHDTIPRGSQVTVRTKVLGLTAKEQVMMDHKIMNGEKLCVSIQTVRSLKGLPPNSFIEALN